MPEKKYDTPLVKKLGIKPGHRLLIVNEPDDFRAKLIGLPDDIIEDFEDNELADVIVWFTIEAADVTFEVVQPTGLATGLVDNKVCAIDSTWTGLRFVFRKK